MGTGVIAPPVFWTKYVTTEDAAAIANSGSFSKSLLPRLSGHRSRSSKTKGKVTIIGLAIRPHAKNARTSE